MGGRKTGEQNRQSCKVEGLKEELKAGGEIGIMHETGGECEECGKVNRGREKRLRVAGRGY